MILHGLDACELTGIPSIHADAFQLVADATGNMIASRAVGIYATGLILENYASKGFHNKAKSCNWGPMAGFVLDDPRFTKVGGSDKGQSDQRASLLHAIEDGAITVPLFISEDRRRWLFKNLLVTPVNVTSDSYFVTAVSPWGLKLEFRLKDARPAGATQGMFQVSYRSKDSKSAARADQQADGEWTPVMAMRDPMCAISAKNYRAATTGDYDLFAIWAKKESYSPGERDKRMVSHATLESNIKAKAADSGEHKHLGNLTPRIRAIRNQLNAAFLKAGYTGGNMIHHSDEGGRPFVTDIDLPIFAVVPGKTEPYAVQSVEDLRQFFAELAYDGYAPVLSPGWMKQIVFGSGPADGMVARATALRDSITNFDKSSLRRV